MPFIPYDHSQRIQLFNSDIDNAINSLHSGRACGFDGLDDITIKKPSLRHHFINRLRPLFEDWINGSPMPQYLKQSKVIPLSKEDGTEYPKVGNIRTIAVAPAL